MFILNKTPNLSVIYLHIVVRMKEDACCWGRVSTHYVPSPWSRRVSELSKSAAKSVRRDGAKALVRCASKFCLC